MPRHTFLIGVLLGACGALWLTAPARTRRVGIVPVFNGRDGGVVAQGRF